jgi:glycosyltransferase involved in cell wall biosynthesis
VGKLRYYKGVDTLLEALTELPGVYLEVVGEGPMGEEWAALAARLGVADRVHFRGQVPDAELPDWYGRAHIFVLPANARAEAFGTVLLEAMASGLPCITTEVGERHLMGGPGRGDRAGGAAPRPAGTGRGGPGIAG